MIIVIAPVPSISYEYNINGLVPNKIVDTSSSNYYVYSKGIHSAKTIKILQDEPLILSTLGGISGKTIKHELNKSKLKADIVWTEADTPQKIKIHDNILNTNYLIATSSKSPRLMELSKLTLKLKENIKKVKTLIISDEFSSPITDDIASIYKDWAYEANKNNVKVILSTGKKSVLDNICSMRPYSLVFTQSQLLELGYDISSNESIINQLLPLKNIGIHYIAVYLRNRSAIIITKNKCYLVNYINSISNDCTNYFGGVFLGCFAIGVNRKYEIEKIGKLSLSAAISASGSNYEPIISRKDIESLSKKTKVTVINI